MNWSLARLAGPCLLVLFVGTASPVLGQTPEVVKGVELVSAQELPVDLVRAAIGNLLGLPRSRATIHDSLERIWSLGLFSEVWVDEAQEPDGIRLRFHLVRRPQIRQIQWLGEAGLPLIDLVEAANLFIGGDGGTDRLEEARRSMLAAYARGGYFAAHVTVHTLDDPSTNTQDMTITLEAGSRAEIGIVTLHGVSESEAARLTEKLRLEPGDEYSEAAVRRRAQAVEEGLRQDGYYETRITLLQSVWDPASNRVNLEFEAAAGPKYLVEFSGVQELNESALRAQLSFLDTGTVDETEVDTSARAIEAAYQEAGFAFAQVSGSLEPAADPRQIRYAVIEGPRVIVDSISFSGNQAFPARRLQEQMETQLPGLFARGAFRQDILDRDLRVLTAFYHTQGYPDVVVGPTDVQFSEDRRGARILIPITEGPHLSIGTITVEGVTLFPAREVLAALPFKTGDPWTQEREAEVRRSIARLYAQRGYLRALIIFEPIRQGDLSDFVIRIQEGTQTRVGRILIGGLISTKEYVVRRELPFAPGDPFNPEGMADAERRLAGLGIFDRVQIGPLQPPPAPFADVSITLREGRPWRVEFGGGYSSSDGWRATLEAGNDNLFGTGQSASIRQRIGQYGDRTDLTYRYPWLFGTPLRGDLGGFQEYHGEHIYGYKQQQEGFAAGIERTLLPVPFKDLYRLRLGLRYQLALVRNYDVSPSLETQGANSIVPGSEIVAKITPAVTADYRDNVLDPKTGSFHTLSLDLAGPYFGSQASFVKTSMETKWFFGGPLQTTLAIDARLGLATPSGNSNSLPATERFYAGGSTTIRGYPQDKVGPLDSNGNPFGGNTLVIGNVEWRFPIWRWLGGAAFLDTGTVAPQVGDLSLSSFKTGVGGGLRITTPIGPVRFDAGYALNLIPGTGRWQFYLAIGHAF
jgi:outer membrane protein insertion porin family